ncbi:MAG: cytochrome c biogenesis protein CcsA [Lentimicrobiaceae bacterium]|nr:cytochrome c biogenesis protein CcsA [Lentimicrobiaceae bacterium]
MFSLFGSLSILCWVMASFFAIKHKERSALFFQIFGMLIFAIFIAIVWIMLQRPPFKTMGETRIWYSFFLSVMGGVTYWRWKMGYLLTFTNLLAIVFVLLTIFKPELQSKVLMPALQSVWFIPHVVVYMFGYAVIGCGVVLGVLEFFRSTQMTRMTQIYTDLLVRIGTVALGVGLCLGALWAKKAWGQYWSWDVKEVAALVTWVIFLLYIHLQKFTRINRKVLLIILMIGFLALQFTWYGVKLLPDTKKSPHSFYDVAAFPRIFTTMVFFPSILSYFSTTKTEVA